MEGKGEDYDYLFEILDCRYGLAAQTKRLAFLRREARRCAADMKGLPHCRIPSSSTPWLVMKGA
jgi:hypothetical protein